MSWPSGFPLPFHWNSWNFSLVYVIKGKLFYHADPVNMNLVSVTCDHCRSKLPFYRTLEKQKVILNCSTLRSWHNVVICCVDITLTISACWASAIFLKNGALCYYISCFLVMYSWLSAGWQCPNTTNRYGVVLFHAERYQMAFRSRNTTCKS